MPPERLDIGSVGEDVARLHKALEARGFAVSAEEEKRRFFGPSTRDALRDCQTCHGLNATGEVDDSTTALLNATRPDLQGRNLSLNMRGPDVDLLLQELRALHFDIAADETGFGQATRKAVVAIQREEGLAPTGIVDQATAGAVNRRVHELRDSSVVAGVVASESGEPPAGARVEAPDLGLSALADKAGRYEIGSLAPGPVRLRASAAEHVPQEAEVVVEAGSAVERDFTLSRTPGGDLIVRGQVRHEDSRPLVNATVRAFDRDLRREEPLGEDIPDAAGRYEIRYTSDQFARAEKDGADLVLRLFGPDGRELAASPVLFNAPAVAELDLTVPAGGWELPSLFETLGLALSPLLGEVALEELDEDDEHQDLSFLAGETGFARGLLARFALSYRLPGGGLQPEFWFAVLGAGALQLSEALSLGAQLPSLLQFASQLDGGAVQKALESAFNRQEIADGLRERIPEWMEAWRRWAGSQTVGDAPTPTFVRAALEHAGVDGADKQEQFGRLYAEYRGVTDEMLKRLEATQLFSASEVADLDTSFRLAELTRGDFSTVKAIKEAFEVTDPEAIRGLAATSENEWVTLVQARHAAGEMTLPLPTGEAARRVGFPAAELYGRTLARRFREAFPTAAFAGDMRRAVHNGGIAGLTQAAEISALLDQHADFDLLTTPVDGFLDERDAGPDLRLELKAIQRVFKLTPSFDATATLLSDGVHSAQQVYRMGEAEFVERYAESAGFTADTARMAWNRAADTNAAVMTILGDLQAFENGVPAALRHGKGSPAASFPNWNNLFKTGDLCECEYCRSVLGPAAYFADLLLFLHDRQAANGSVKDVLFRRRPDLGWLELNCPNASTALPYVDVVNEVLEAVAAADENDLELPGFTTMPADPAVAEQESVSALAKAGANVGGDVSLSQVDTDEWVVHGSDATYRLRKKATPKFFADVLRNTKATADELRAYPQYVNPKAYDKLRQARYPLSLPFDLPGQEVRATFVTAGLQRWDLMRAMRGPASDGDIAAEYFGIGGDEKRLIVTADPTAAGQQVLWGEPGNAAWLTAVGNVSNFLRKTGLEYDELLALRDLKFVNPNGDLGIDRTDPSCDTAKQTITALDPEKLDRIHRFLRLWRKLNGWQMWELDLVLSDPRVGRSVLNEGFLVRLFQLSEVRRRLGGKTTVEQMMGLFSNLNTGTWFTKQFETRGQGLYRDLFLNRKLMRPLDPAFEVAAVTAQPPTQMITGHLTTIVSALGVTEADLAVLRGLTRASNGLPYITDDLTLGNLSFLWRHAWLAKALKFKAQEWRLLLRLLDLDLARFASPAAALAFMDTIDALQATGVTVDELSWLLAADRTAKAATKETDAASFLRTLRKALQAIRAEHEPAQYDFLGATPPTDVDRLDALLTRLLAELKWSDADSRGLLATLRGKVILETGAAGLPAAFAFPAAVTGGAANIPIAHDPPAHVLRFTGTMTAAQRTSLQSDTGPALTALRTASRPEAQALLPAGFAFPGTVTGPPNNIAIQYDEPNTRLLFTGLMTEAQRTLLLSDASLAAISADPAYVAAVQEIFAQSTAALTAYRGAIDDLYQQSVGAPAVYAVTRVHDPAAGGLTLPPAWPSIPITYDTTSQTFSFIGLMTIAEQGALKAANPAAPIDDLFRQPRLAAKFFEPVFIAPLEWLPKAVDFKTLLPGELAARIAYDEEERALRFTGLLGSADAALLKSLVTGNTAAEDAYRAAVDSLASQPQAIAAADPRVWLTDAELDGSQPSTDTLAKRLANTARKALAYLSRTLAENAVVDAASAQLGLTAATTRFLATSYSLAPGTLMAQLTGSLAASTGTVDYTTLKDSFNCWFWAIRVAAIWNRAKLTLAELRQIDGLSVDAKLLDPGDLPLDDTGAVASLEGFLRLARLVRLRDSFSEPSMSYLTLLERLHDGKYAADVDVPGLPAGFTFPKTITDQIPINYDEPDQKLRYKGSMSIAQRDVLLNDAALAAVTGIASYAQAVQNLYEALIAEFAADVEQVAEDWPSADVAALIRALDLKWPDEYLLAESWERLRRAFYFAANLNAGATTLSRFATPAMSDAEARTVKELMRSKLGPETWLSLCAEIQDVLRERKRDALAAYLLTQPKPADAPTGKWENTNDLYAYYLLDVEMSACQLTSRLVQASGSVQLFVQRCFMGLEPAVAIAEDGTHGDSAWRWWTWMRKYRVWEANRKVFLWPENWIEPELKKDRSSFFRDMENELTQNEVSQDSAETAFGHYLDKLHGVAHLEVAGFYQEDDGDNTIVHVFARTPGGEPHHYYYRRFDYHQWTPWERVDVEIQGDYLIPAVVNRRLFLFWPVFKEMPHEALNSSVTLPPALGNNPSKFTPDKTSKVLRMQMAVSEYRQGQWIPKQISTTFDESVPYDVNIVARHYSFFPIDRIDSEGRFFIMYGGSSDRASAPGSPRAHLMGEAEISGCTSTLDLVITPTRLRFGFQATWPDPQSTGTLPVDLAWAELKDRDDKPDTDLTLLTTYIGGSVNPIKVFQKRAVPLMTEVRTPGLFRLALGWHQSYLNRLSEKTGTYYAHSDVITGTWLPFFYREGEHTFFVLPSTRHSVPVNQVLGNYYPEVKAELRNWESYFGNEVDNWVDGFIHALSPAERADLGNWLFDQLQLPSVPVTDAELRAAIKQDPGQATYYYLREMADGFVNTPQYHFHTFYHALVCEFGKLANNPLKGIPALMSRDTQFSETNFRFKDTYYPTASVVTPADPRFYPAEDVDFRLDGAYSLYNWELFFHAPLYIANQLSRNQRFEEARDWYHFIFNPLGVKSAIPGGSPMSRFWVTKPFYQATDPQYLQQRIDSILRLLAGDPTAPGYPEAMSDVIAAVYDWRTNPFEPHRIAAYRTVAYQKTVVTNYVENLIAWGDYLFRQDTMESINEATQLYVMAAEILGPKPKAVPPPAKPPEETFNELEHQFDTFANALVQVENLVPAMPGHGTSASNQPPIPTLYFCIPTNDKLLAHWDTVADRLYKIRQCMNIEGVTRQLALFEPPIDPAALVKAVAGGVDIAAALSDLDAPLPFHRFAVLLQKANEVCGDVKSLGAALTAVLEKKDAEALGLLRQTQEIRLLEAVKALREQQIDEAKKNLEALKRSKVVVEMRRDFYRDVERLNAQETLHLGKLNEAHTETETAEGIMLAAAIISYLPSIDIGGSGFGGSPVAKVKIGGLEFGQAASLTGQVHSLLSQIASNDAAMASSKATFDRRWNDWKLQEQLADKELDQFESQIAAAELRVALAEKELSNHVVQMESAKATDEFMRSKYTNQDLYQWQTGQVSGVYFQTYKLAYDLAKRAERCFRFELGVADSSYISFGYWDSLKKGLMAGERLQYDLRRLEAAYLQQERREFELTKHVSLALLDPLALVKLRETGRCFFRLPEELFDLDYPGHYFRRIKSVSLSLPAVAGPYTTVSCTLRLLGNSLRVNTARGDKGYPRNVDDQRLPADDSRFVENNVPFRAIAASSAQNDSGVFELSFRDDRYLPFEGAGAISDWALELFTDLPSNNPDPANPDHGAPLRQFDYRTISDAIVHVKYTAREDAGVFKNGAVAHLREYFAQQGTVPSVRLLDLRQEFPSQWSRFLTPADPAARNVFELEMRPELFPWRDAGKTLKVQTISLLARCTDAGAYTATLSPPLPQAAAPDPNKFTLTRLNQYGGLHIAQKDVSALGIEVPLTDPPVKWQLKMSRPDGGNLQEDMEDMLVAVGYVWDA